MSGLKLVPISIAAANEYVAHHHRHHRKVQGALFALSAEKDAQLVGVAIVGRPCRMLQNGFTAEVTRCCTDGTHNACSFLYARCRRALAALGYTDCKTYTRQDESGSSLKAAGFVQEALLPARSYSKSNVSRIRHDSTEPFPRIRWGATV